MSSPAQVTGGYETYGRRYNLIKLLNCVTEDNDAADVFRIAIDRLSKAEDLDKLREVIQDASVKTMKVNSPKAWDELLAYTKDRRVQFETVVTEEEGADDADSDS